MEKKRFDAIVIGAGTGGYVSAIKLAQNGKTVCLIDKSFLGGCCLNVGCIPTKTLLSHAETMLKFKHAEEFGFNIGQISFNFAKMKQRKDQVVERLRKGLETLMKTNSITVMRGTAEFLSPQEIKVVGQDGGIVWAENVIIATGSEPLDIPAFPCDNERILNSTSILELTELPKSLAVIGGGYIGCEFASLYASFGVKVTILEALPSIVSMQGKTASEMLTNAFTKQGIQIKTGVFVEGIDRTKNGVHVRLKGAEPVDADMALVSVGRKIISNGLAIEKAGVVLGEKGAIVVNDKMETNVPGIYAVGDVTGKFMLAHVASHQGIVAASNILGQEMLMNYNAVPSVIFTHPEIAMVGMTLEQAQAAGYSVSVGKFPFQALGRAIATGDADGFTEVLSDKKTGQILGALVVGHDASTLIAEMGLAITNELTVECVADTIHAHPTLPEAWAEASLMAMGMPLHFPPKKKAQ